MIHRDSPPEAGHPARAAALRTVPTQPTASELAVVTVLFNSADVIEECLASLPPETEVIVVDNASEDDGVARARAVRPDAIVIESERNLGFGAGCNLGWRAASQPYVAFVNPDVRLEPETLAILVRKLAEEPHAMVGPALLDEDGETRPCKRSPSAMLDFVGLMPSAARWAPAGWDGKVERDDLVHTSGGPVACVEGACFVMSRNDLEAIRGFDEDFFLYYEEESIALRLARLGGRAIYEPSAVAHHAGATSTRRVAAVATRHFHRSRIIFYRKRDGDPRGILTALLLALGVLVSLPVSVLNMLLGRRRLATPTHQLQVLCGLFAGIAARPRSGVSYSGGGVGDPVTGSGGSGAALG